MAVTAGAIISAFVFTHLIPVVSLLCFSFLRNLSFTRRFYAPKRFDTKQAVKPRRLPSGWILWIWHLLRIPDDEIITVAGMDSAVYIRTLRMAWHIMLVVTVWCVVVVMPVNLSGGEVARLMGYNSPPPYQAPSAPPQSDTALMGRPQDPPRPLLPYFPAMPAAVAPPTPPASSQSDCIDSGLLFPCPDGLSDFELTGLANIPPGSPKMLVHVISVYVVTAIVLAFLWKYSNENAKLRVLFMAGVPKGGPSHTVLVTDIPGLKYGTIPWTFKRVMHSTLFRLLPASWRDKLVELVDDVMFRGIAYAWRKAKVAASKARVLRLRVGGEPGAATSSSHSSNGGLQPSASGRARFGHFFSYSQAGQDNNESGSGGAAAAAPEAGSYSFSSPFSSGVWPTRGSSVTSIQDVREHSGSDAGALQQQQLGRPVVTVTLGGTGADTEPPGRCTTAETSSPRAPRPPRGVDPFVRSYADKLNVELDPPEVGAIKVAQLKSRVLDVWAIAEDFLTKPQQPGRPPPTFRDMIAAEFSYVYGKHAVAAVNPVWDQGELDPLIREFDRTRTRLEDFLDWAATRIRRRLRLKPKMIRIVPLVYGSWGAKHFGVKPVKVDAVAFWCMRLTHLAAEIEATKARAEGVRFTPSAFVTFHSRVAQVIAATTLHQHVESLWRVVPAPEPREVLWSNVKLRAWEREVRGLAHWVAYFGLLCFYVVPITAVQGLLNLPAVMRTMRVDSLVPVFTVFTQSIIPGLTLKICMRFMPYVLDIMCRYTGFISESAVDFAVVHRYFAFQVIILFIGSLVSGTFWRQLEDVLKNPTAVLKSMATSVPTAASFFLNYTVVAGLGAYSLAFLRPFSLATFLTHSRIVTTPRQRQRLWAEHYMVYGNGLPDNCMIFLFGVVFSVINPVVCTAVLSYFSFVLVFERYDNLYVYKRKYESGGRVWATVFNQMMSAVYFMQLMLMMLVALKGSALAALILPALVLTVVFHLVCRKVFNRPWRVLSLHDASYLDYKDRQSRSNGGEALTEAEKAAISAMYLSPAFKRRPTDLGELLLEAEKVRRLAAGESLEAILEDLGSRGLNGSAQSPGGEGSAGAPVGGCSTGAAPGQAGQDAGDGDESPPRRGYGSAFPERGSTDGAGAFVSCGAAAAAVAEKEQQVGAPPARARRGQRKVRFREDTAGSSGGEAADVEAGEGTS